MNAFTRAAIVAGLVAGIIYMILQMFLNEAFADRAIWTLPKLIAAVILGKGILQDTAHINGTEFITFAIIHLLMSIVFAMVVGLFVRGANMPVGLAVGAGAGIVLYIMAFLVMTFIFDWFLHFRGWVSLIDHIIFGIITAWVFKLMLRNTSKTEEELTRIKDGQSNL